MHVRLKTGIVAAAVVGFLVAVGYVCNSESPDDYYKRALAAEEAAAFEAAAGRYRLTDRVCQWFGRAPVDHLAAVAHHQQALINSGVLVRRDLMLTRDYDLTLFSASNMVSIGGEFSYVWFISPRQLTVIAKPERIDGLTRWIQEQHTGAR